MEQSKIDIFISSMNEKFKPEDMMAVREQLEQMDDDRFPLVQALNYKNPTTLLIISIFLGSLGVDRFMMGHVGLGILKLLTGGALGVWTIIDWFLIMGIAKKHNFKIFMENTQ